MIKVLNAVKTAADETRYELLMDYASDASGLATGFADAAPDSWAETADATTAYHVAPNGAWVKVGEARVEPDPDDNGGEAE